jgi:hypothetical protein
VQRVGKSKVTKLTAKADAVYPLIRLPKAYKDEIGKTAEIFETQHDNKRVLLVTFNELAEANSEVKQPERKVIQLECQKEIEARLLLLESEISDLKSALFLNESSSFNKIKNRWARGDSNARPSPCKGDLITS